MIRAIRSFVVVAVVAIFATTAHAAVTISDLSGAAGSSTGTFTAFATNVDTQQFDFNLTSTAANDLTLTYFSPSAFGAMASASATLYGPSGGTFLGSLVSGVGTSIAQSVFATTGSYSLYVTAFGDIADAGGTKSYEFSLGVNPTVTPIPASVALLGTGIAGLGALRLRRRTARQAA